MHPTDKKFLVSIIFCLFVAIGLIASAFAYRMGKLEESLSDMQIKAEADAGFKHDTLNQLGVVFNHINYISTNSASRDYLDRVAQATMELQRWRLIYTNQPSK